MAEMISQEIRQVESEQIQQIIENSFTPDALSLVGSKYFIDSLLEVDPELVLWSEGDISWQASKASRTGLTTRQSIRLELIGKNKTSELKDIILSLADEFGEKVHVVVIDDKEKNLAHASSLQDQVLDSGIIISIYHLNLNDVQADPANCLAFLSEIKEKNIRLIVDMDGVLINADRVLLELVAPKIVLLLQKLSVK